MIQDKISEDFDNVPCGFLKMSESAVITAVNSTLLTLLNAKEPDNIIGRKFDHLLTIAGKIFFQTHFFPMLKLHGEAQEIFFNLRKEEAGEFPVICNVVSKTENDARVFLCIFFPVAVRGKYEQSLLDAKREAEKAIEDNTDLIAAKRELEERILQMDMQTGRLAQLNADITQFSKIISHDLQESIRKIALFADRISLDEGDVYSSINKVSLEKIKTACTKLRTLTTELEKFISLETDTEKLGLVKLSDIINLSWSQAKATIETQNLEFDLKNDCTIPGYHDQLGILFFELFKKLLQFKTQDNHLRFFLEISEIKQNSLHLTEYKYLYTEHIQINFFVRSNVQLSSESILIFNDSVNLISFKSLEFAICKKIVSNHNGTIEIFASESKERIIRLVFPLKR
jgi:sigma-B regulation protein RsbU (phosphoserine phosphatase)